VTGVQWTLRYFGALFSRHRWNSCCNKRWQSCIFLQCQSLCGSEV